MQAAARHTDKYIHRQPIPQRPDPGFASTGRHPLAAYPAESSSARPCHRDYPKEAYTEKEGGKSAKDIGEKEGAKASDESGHQEKEDEN